MKTKFNGILTLLLALVVQISFAQEKTISGTVTDESGALPGVSVLIKGTTTGTETDFDGKYVIKAKTGDVLVFSFIGMKTVNRSVGVSNTINVTMAEDANVLDEVVVTALGIKRDKQALGYATQQVDSESLEKGGAGDTNIANALNGQVTGVNIVGASGDVGSPTSVIIRGTSSLTGSNQALFVVDGVPINNESFGNVGGGDEISSVNRAGDIDFTNVESISVLKGGAATVLYGERGANGVILITTKKGTGSDKLNINVNSSYSLANPNKFPEFTQKFARGRNGGYSNVTHWSWGPAYANNPKFAPGTNVDLNGTGTAVDVGGQAIPYHANNYERWFNTGTTATNNISLSGSNDKGNFYTSYTRIDQEGIVPNSSLLRNSFNINGSYNLSDKISFGANVNFVRSETNKAASGVNGWGDGLGYWHHMWDVTNRPWKDANGQKTWFSNSVPDPNWIVYEDNQLSEVNRIFGNINFNYAISKWFNLGFKLGIDTFTDLRKRYRPSSAVQSAARLGDGYEFSGNATDLTTQLSLSGQGEISEDIGVSYMVGTSIFESRYKSLSTLGSTEILPNFYTLDNYVTITANPYIENYRLIGLFGDVTFDYKDYLYLGFTARNDWSSTLPSDNNTFFYPSANASIIFSKLLESKDVINYGKFRASIAQTGKSAPAYRIQDVFVKNGNNVLGLPQFTASNLARNPNLKPEVSTEYEFGLDMKFLESKIGLDLTYYNKLSSDQILNATVGPTTGFGSTVINGGDIRNSGIELQLSVRDLFKISDDFNWGVNLNFTKNKNRVETIADGFVDQVVIGNGWWSSTQRVARVGHSAGLIIGKGYERNANGDILVADNGNPILGDGKILGDVFPDWNLGVNTNLSYKNFNLSFLFDIRKGGDVINDSKGWWVYSGLSKFTENRFYSNGDTNANATTVIKGVNATTGAANNVAIPLTNNYYHAFVSFNDEELIEDASWVRLRTVSLSYSLPKEYLQKIGLSNLQFGIIGNNLWLDTNYSGIDPEVSGRGVTNNSGYDINGAPSTKSYTVNVKFGF